MEFRLDFVFYLGSLCLSSSGRLSAIPRVCYIRTIICNIFKLISHFIYTWKLRTWVYALD